MAGLCTGPEDSRAPDASDGTSLFSFWQHRCTPRQHRPGRAARCAAGQRVRPNDTRGTRLSPPITDRRSLNPLPPGAPRTQLWRRHGATWPLRACGHRSDALGRAGRARESEERAAARAAAGRGSGRPPLPLPPRRRRGGGGAAAARRSSTSPFHFFSTTSSSGSSEALCIIAADRFAAWQAACPRPASSKRCRRSTLFPPHAATLRAQRRRAVAGVPWLARERAASPSPWAFCAPPQHGARQHCLTTR